jgi:hypothetical protein
MRTEKEIREAIVILELKLSRAKQEYSKLHQIELGSGSGNQMRKHIARTEGKIHALKYVVDDDPET